MHTYYVLKCITMSEKVHFFIYANFIIGGPLAITQMLSHPCGTMRKAGPKGTLTD